MIKRTSKILLLSLAIFTPIVFLFAASSNAINNPIGPSNMDINQLVVELLKIVAQLGAIVCVFFIIYAGFLFVKARGNEAEVTKAKNVLLWSVIGAAVLLGASAIAEVIKGTVESVTNIQLPR
ncbi:MAG: hypothetical protein WCO12_03540 [bacterium]